MGTEWGVSGGERRWSGSELSQGVGSEWGMSGVRGGEEW